ncbi:hypothetical protein [Deinococcus sp.]|uniref:hypothetical protein n=1 Tax=Deinococcus sp. TaxID=47478 RepID=UPI002869D546|nr:hypothetical protein [Deinococcus sp.]
MNALHVLNAGGHLNPALDAEVRAVTQAALDRHAAVLALDGVDVAVWVTPWGLPETGIHGYAPLDHLVQISVNPDNPHFAVSWRTELTATLAHELHHARRWSGRAPATRCWKGSSARASHSGTSARSAAGRPRTPWRT